MNKPKSHPKVEYIEVPEKEPGGKLDMAFTILFDEVMKDRKIRKQIKSEQPIPSIQV